VQDVFGAKGSKVIAGAVFKEWFGDWDAVADLGMTFTLLNDLLIERFLICLLIIRLC